MLELKYAVKAYYLYYNDIELLKQKTVGRCECLAKIIAEKNSSSIKFYYRRLKKLDESLREEKLRVGDLEAVVLVDSKDTALEISREFMKLRPILIRYIELKDKDADYLI